MTIGAFSIAAAVLAQAAPTSSDRVKVPPKRSTIVAAMPTLIPEPR